MAEVKDLEYFKKKDPGFSEKTVAEELVPEEERFTHKRFTYLMAWNGIPVGRIIAEFGDVIEYKGDKVYVFTLITKSNDFLSKIYRVEDTYTSYVDVNTIASKRYEADRQEGTYRKHVIVEYDFDKMEAVYVNHTDGSRKTCKIMPDVQDPLSAMCYFMTLPVRIGEDISLTVNLNEKNYTVSGTVESLEVIDLPGIGIFPAFKIAPKAVYAGKRYRKGRGYMYFSIDSDRYPLYGVVTIPFGKVTATLRSIEEI